MSPQQPRNDLTVEKHGGLADSVVVKIAKTFGYGGDGTPPPPPLPCRVSSEIGGGGA